MTINLPDKERFTPAEVSDLLGVCQKTVYIWIHGGRLSAEKLGHRTIRISRQAIREFLSASEMQVGFQEEDVNI